MGSDAGEDAERDGEKKKEIGPKSFGPVESHFGGSLASERLRLSHCFMNSAALPAWRPVR
jgi:hypothetical protein